VFKSEIDGSTFAVALVRRARLSNYLGPP